jgi:hypothetical protein
MKVQKTKKPGSGLPKRKPKNRGQVSQSVIKELQLSMKVQKRQFLRPDPEVAFTASKRKPKTGVRSPKASLRNFSSA